MHRRIAVYHEIAGAAESVPPIIHALTVVVQKTRELKPRR
jgi:hypothetical protein